MAERPIVEVGPRGGKIVGHRTVGGKQVAEYQRPEHGLGGALRPSQPRLFDSPRVLTLKPPEAGERRRPSVEEQPDLFGPPRTMVLRAQEAAMERRVTKPTKPLPWAPSPAAERLAAQSSGGPVQDADPDAENAKKYRDKSPAELRSLALQHHSRAARHRRGKRHGEAAAEMRLFESLSRIATEREAAASAGKATGAETPAYDAKGSLAVGESRQHGGIKASHQRGYAPGSSDVHLTGDTYHARDEILRLGARWAGQLNAWIIPHDAYVKNEAKIHELGLRAKDAAAAEKESGARRRRAGPSSPSRSGRATEKQLAYAGRLLSRTSNRDWFDTEWGDGGIRKPTAEQIRTWSAAEVSALIKELRGLWGGGSAYKDLSGTERLLAQIAERAA